MQKQVGSQSLVGGRDLNEEIAKVAYGLYKKRGMADGHHYEDWLKAEKIVMEQYAKTKKEIDLMSEVAEEKASRRAAVKQAKRR
jgi:hypothetical protein